MLPQQGKQTVALETSSWLLVWLQIEDFRRPLQSVCCVVVGFQPLIYLQSHHMPLMDRQLWYHCPSLPERTAGWHITTQTYPYSGRQCHPLLAPQSHGPLFGDVTVSVWTKKKKKGGSFAIRAENNAHFLLGMEMVISPPIFGLWMTGHNVARWDNSSLNHADQREWTNSWSYVEPVEDILIFWPFKEIWKFGFLKV